MHIRFFQSSDVFIIELRLLRYENTSQKLLGHEIVV